jgi:signal transduction histidine kinase
MKLRTKFAVALLVLVVVLSGVVYGELELYKDRAVGQVEANVEETARLTAEQVDSTVAEKTDYVGLVASRPEATELDRSGPYLDAFLDNSRFMAAQIVATNGTVVAYRGDVTRENRQRTLGSNVDDEPYFQRAVEGETYVNDTEYVEATGKHLLVIAAPIADDEGVVGVLAAAIYVDAYSFFPMVAPLETNDQAVAVRADGELLHEPHEEFEQDIAASARVESTGWRVTVSRDSSALTARLRELALVQGASLLVVLLSMVAFGIWEYNANLRQTDRLLAGFRALGDGEYDRRLDLASGDEWVQISEGFNDLAAGLATHEAEIRERGQRLEILNRVLRHNLRNDVTVVVNYAELLAERVETEQLRTAAEKIQAKSLGLIDLGEKAHRIESAVESAEDRMRPVDLVAVVEGVLADLRPEYPDVTVETDLPAGAAVEAIPALDGAVAELVENACKHNDAPDPTVRVAVESDGATVRLTITDDGPGIPEQEYSVLDAGQETQLEHASGLGLWLAYWIVTKCGGELSVADSEPRGAVVTVELPVTGEPTVEPTAESTAERTW